MTVPRGTPSAFDSSSYVHPSMCFRTISSPSSGARRSIARHRSRCAADTPGSNAVVGHDSAFRPRASSRTLLETPVAQQHVEPGIERPGRVEGAQVAERVHECLLRGVGRVRLVARQDPRVRQRARLVPIDQMPKASRFRPGTRERRRRRPSSSAPTIREAAGLFSRAGCAVGAGVYTRFTALPRTAWCSKFPTRPPGLLRASG